MTSNQKILLRMAICDGQFHPQNTAKNIAPFPVTPDILAATAALPDAAVLPVLTAYAAKKAALLLQRDKEQTAQWQATQAAQAALAAALLS